jgi:hypothetical protein
MKKTLKALAGLALVAALTFGLYSDKDKEVASEVTYETQSFQGDPGGGPGV